MEPTLPWIEKYRPTTFNEIIAHTEIINTLKIFIDNKCLPHLLFYGPPGSGKTTTITVTAKKLYGKYFPYMVMELNASDDRGIEVVRNKIKQFVISKCAFFGETAEDKKNIFKLVILDETDAMTGDAQAILRKIVEKYTYNTRFCLICNYIQNINPALQSRCTKFRFSPINNDEIKKKIIEISNMETIKIDEIGINTIIRRSSGDLRKVLNIMQSCSMIYPIINEENINQCLGYPMKYHIKDILNNLINNNYETAYNNILKIKSQYGLSLGDIITEIHDIFINYIIDDDKSQYSYYIDLIKNLNLSNIINIIDKMRIIEYNHSANTIESIQLGGLIGIFKIRGPYPISL